MTDENGKLVGIVSRRDLISVFLRPDVDIAADIRRVLDDIVLARSGEADVAVHNGIVTLIGTLDPKAGMHGDLIPVALRLMWDVTGSSTSWTGSARAGRPVGAGRATGRHPAPNHPATGRPALGRGLAEERENEMSITLRKDPRTMFPDLIDWFEEPFLSLRPYLGQPIRIEDYVEDGRYVVRAEVPGIDPEEDLEVTAGAGCLTISARRSSTVEDRHRSEFRYGSLKLHHRAPRWCRKRRRDRSLCQGHPDGQGRPEGRGAGDREEDPGHCREVTARAGGLPSRPGRPSPRAYRPGGVLKES